MFERRRRLRLVGWAVALALTGPLIAWDASALVCTYEMPPKHDFRSLGALMDQVGRPKDVLVCHFSNDIRVMDFVNRYARSFCGRAYSEARGKGRSKAGPATAAALKAKVAARGRGGSFREQTQVRTVIPEAFLQAGRPVWYVTQGRAIQGPLEVWLKTHPRVRAYRVGCAGLAVSVLIPDGVFPSAVARDQYVEKLYRQSVRTSDAHWVNTLWAEGDYLARKYGLADHRTQAVYEVAAQRMDWFCARSPYSLRVRYWAELVMRKVGRFDAALKDCAAAVNLSFGKERTAILKDYGRTWQEKADALVRAGELAQARAAYMGLYHWEGGRRPDLWLRAARLTLRLKGVESERNELLRLVRAHPDYWPARAELRACSEKLSHGQTPQARR